MRIYTSHPWLHTSLRCTWPLTKVSDEHLSEFSWVKGQCVCANTLQPVFDPIRTPVFLPGDDAAVGGAVPTCQHGHLSRAPEVGCADPL